MPSVLPITFVPPSAGLLAPVVDSHKALNVDSALSAFMDPEKKDVKKTSDAAYQEARAAAMYASQCNQYLTAIVRFTKMEFNYGLRIQELYHRALAALGKKYPEFALADGMTMIDENKENYRGYWLSGLAYERLSKYDLAREIYATGISELDDLMSKRGRSFSGLVSGKMVLKGCIETLDSRVLTDISAITQGIQSLSISASPKSADSTVATTLSSPVSSPPSTATPDPLESRNLLDPAAHLPIEILLDVLSYVDMDFRTAVRFQSLSRTWRNAVRSTPKFWKVLDLTRVNWDYMTKDILQGYVDCAMGVERVHFDWVVPNKGEDDFDERWYELLWWIASLQRYAKTNVGGCIFPSNQRCCTFALTPCVPYLSRHRPVEDNMLVIQWGPEEHLAIPEKMVSELLGALASRKTRRPGSLRLFEVSKWLLTRERWDGGMEPQWVRDEFSFA
ncbi:hypothetical protein POJ06DRAFT_46135 [Lipomyces tetrasporus]|uniref:F-box domain-containing protein n=1 Tax=Lipomyces tetrasporus TaxID=54092 RepID=A0AAD7VQ90_9ASCO|nr:uncharacterized protein POJ06DRAFT_46135 [Lipomyces tetrasporus]KAJ8096895.1 hypothetical protein POJ06DRAFT_46135 [Lipomyces tetrasporus]